MAGAREAGYLFALAIVVGAVMIGLYLFELLPRASAPFAFVLPIVLAISVYLALQIARTGETPADRRLLLPGFGFLIGGAAFDIAATLYHTPDLATEANPIARALLDGGHSVALVYVFAGVCQTLYVVLLCLLWVGLVKHRGFLISSLRSERSPLTFLKAATGGRELTWRQWVFPLRLSEMPDARYAVWVLAVVLLAGSVTRWYLGFEWFGFVRGWHIYVGVGAIAGGVCAYLVWLWRASRRTEGA